MSSEQEKNPSDIPIEPKTTPKNEKIELKEEESLESLAKRLQEKYGITDDDLGFKKQKTSDSTELGHSLQDEIADRTFIDLEKYAHVRSRIVENKYGLKPMSEILSPKTEEEKQKELEAYLKRNSVAPGSIMDNAAKKFNKISAVAEKEMKEMKEYDESYPSIYTFFENVPWYKPEVNIGEKWANQVTSQVSTELEINRSLKRGGYIYQQWKSGKVGVDKYLVIFGVCGAFVLPIYLYFRSKSYKEFIQNERGIRPGDDVDLENMKYDIDDISSHKRFYVDREEKQKSQQKLAIHKEIRKLENELYPEGGFKSPFGSR